jgi:Flp pilus assembly protein TadD
VQKSGLLISSKDAGGALDEAQKAEALAPDSAAVNAAMGRALEANGRAGEADTYYRRALGIAQMVEPQFQVSLIKEMERRLGGGQR